MWLTDLELTNFMEVFSFSTSISGVFKSLKSTCKWVISLGIAFYIVRKENISYFIIYSNTIFYYDVYVVKIIVYFTFKL